MSFLHPEFIVWMTPFVIALFYFWFTQTPHNEHHFTPRALEQLRVLEQTLSLNGRNALFLTASLLSILALAQPVVKEERIVETPEKITIALDISIHPLDEFEIMKKNALILVDESREAVELVAFDSSVYYIAPSSNDKKTLKELIQNLSPHAMHSYIADEKTMRTKLKGSIVLTVSGNKPVDKREIENRKEHWRYFPLFYFPLGLAMILTALALSSMTKRQSVSIMFIVMILLGERDANAGVMDFRILDRATIAYENGEYEQSVRLFSEYQRLNDTPQVRYNLANALFKAGHYQKARYWYKSVVTNDPMLKEWVRINTALLPAEKGETAQDLAQKKVDLELKTDSKKGNKIVNIVNTTPLFVY